MKHPEAFHNLIGGVNIKRRAVFLRKRFERNCSAVKWRLGIRMLEWAGQGDRGAGLITGQDDVLK
jgi:hypothetical protein